jgi:hypothetical protein
VPEYLIEVPHSPEECWVPPVEAAAERARIRSYRGCGSGTHTTWIIGEVAAEDEAWRLVPVLLRDTARVVGVEHVGPDPTQGADAARAAATRDEIRTRQPHAKQQEDS